MHIPKLFFQLPGIRAFFLEPGLKKPAGRILGLNIDTGLCGVFSIPQFDEKTEQHFLHERFPSLLTPLKSALALGSITFATYILLDVYNENTSILQGMARMVIVLLLFTLFGFLNYAKSSPSRINAIAKLSSGLSAIDLMAVLVLEGNPVYYAETWPGLLPIYFFSYGQMFMSLRATLCFGWLSTLAMPLCGYWIGVETVSLIPSVLMLTIVNVFGLCTRCQLEAYARHSFLKKFQAEKNAEDKTRFLHQLSHNLRQPLQALSCYSSVLDAACNETIYRPLQHTVGRLGLVIDELNNAFNHVMDVANLQTGKQTPLLTTVDINVLLATLEHQFAPQANKRGLKFKVVLRRSPPYTVRSDASILLQIVGNLLDNAIKYTQSGWILLTAINIGQNRLQLHVYDTGPGIADTMQKPVFEEFFRNQRRQTDGFIPGLGIGLAYVSVATQCLPGHQLQLHSRLDRGCDFQLNLPVAHNKVETNTRLPQPGQVAGRFIFVVDDDPDVLNALDNQLNAWGCLVQPASGITELRATLADTLRTPDLLITDFYLGEKETAHEVIAAIQTEYGPIPTLILSAKAIDEQDKRQWPENTQLLRKPAGAVALMQAMLKAMT